MNVSKKAYWYYLLGGWIVYAIFYFYTNSVGYIDSLPNAFLNCLFTAVSGILISSLYRWIAIQFGWLDLSLKWLIMKVVFAVIIMAFVMTVLNLVIENFTFPQFTQDIVYSGETDHVIPWQTDQGFCWQPEVANAVEELSKVVV